MARSVSLASVLVIACGSSHDDAPDPVTRLDLGLVGEGLEDDHEGHNVVALARRQRDGAIVGKVQRTRVEAGAFQLVWRGVLVREESFEVVYFVDDSTECVDAGPDVWRLRFGPVSNHVLIETVHDHTKVDPSACAAFDLFELSFTGSGYVEHNGEMMMLAVVRAADEHLIAGPTRTTVISGAVFVQWGEVLQPGFAYAVNYYADHNGSGACEAFPLDHSWAVPFGPVTKDWTVNHSAEAHNDYVCDTFAWQ